jgi:hypothetical protein
VAYTQGEVLGKSNSFGIHFEKANMHYKGAFQFINQAYAEHISRTYNIINREQDMGDEGLRQAKLSYRPSGFVKKYKINGLSRHG